MDIKDYTEEDMGNLASYLHQHNSPLEGNAIYDIVADYEFCAYHRYYSIYPHRLDALTADKNQVPLFLNDPDEAVRIIVKWRLDNNR